MVVTVHVWQIGTRLITGVDIRSLWKLLEQRILFDYECESSISEVII